jgi:hypothetical protein
MIMDVFSGSFPPLVAVCHPPASGNVGFAGERWAKLPGPPASTLKRGTRMAAPAAQPMVSH